MAAKTKQRIDPNQELIGQGLANIVGSFSQAFPVSGSFSRSAVNLNAGAKTGMSSVFTGLIVLVTLLFLTPLLYHLPQAVLAAVIMMAVIGLVNFKAIKHAWHAHKHDGIAAVVTFVATLAFAPHLDNGIMVGAGLAIILYLYRTMSPRVAILGRYHDGTLRDVKVHRICRPASTSSRCASTARCISPTCPTSKTPSSKPWPTTPMPNICWSWATASTSSTLRARKSSTTWWNACAPMASRVVFSGLKKQVIDVMRHSGLFDLHRPGQASFPR